MSTITNRKLTQRLTGLKQEQLMMQKQIQARRLKKRLVETQCLKYGVSLANWAHLTDLQIIDAVRDKWRRGLATAAAKKMASWLQMNRLARLKEKAEARQHSAAYKIQQAWRSFKVTSTQMTLLDPRLRLLRETEAATTIQRVYRGYR
jgi:hypothetical protein